ncbi:MAG: 50S ribosomal protein L13 [Chitinispirillaceae bacterium]|nr:50S ribosomal protein L13 [Chitinispirillaceae bacterium]
MKTVVVNEKTIERKWYVVDASFQPLGRLASKIATILIGKNKVAYSPNQDHGDNVIVINAEKVVLTGKKAEMKTYFRHSMFPGGAKIRSFKEQLKLDPTKIIIHAVRGMIPKNARGRAILRKLFVYAGENHPHIAQKPEAIKI